MFIAVKCSKNSSFNTPFVPTWWHTTSVRSLPGEDVKRLLTWIKHWRAVVGKGQSSLWPGDMGKCLAADSANLLRASQLSGWCLVRHRLYSSTWCETEKNAKENNKALKKGWRTWMATLLCVYQSMRHLAAWASPAPGLLTRFSLLSLCQVGSLLHLVKASLSAFFLHSASLECTFELFSVVHVVEMKLGSWVCSLA